MAVGIEKRENWLDICLAWAHMDEWPYESDADDKRRERLVRLWKSAGMSTVGPTTEEWQLLGDFITAVATWANLSTTGKTYLAENIRNRLSHKASPVNDGLVMARIHLDAWVAKTKPTVRFRVDPKKPDELESLVDESGLHKVTTAEFFEFLRDPHPVRTCAYCDAPFAARKNATYCSTGCRTLAARWAAEGFT